MVYSFTYAPLENCSVTKKDRNIGRSLGNHDEVACITYSGFDLGGIVDPFSVAKPTLRTTEFEERQGD